VLQVSVTQGAMLHYILCIQMATKKFFKEKKNTLKRLNDAMKTVRCLALVNEWILNHADSAL